MSKKKRKSNAVTGQVGYCFMLMDRLHGNVMGRERLRSHSNTLPSYGYGLERNQTKTYIQRQITELRAALLELSKMIGD